MESLENKPPVKSSVEVSGPEDMQIRIVRSANATVKIPRIGDIEPGEGSNGYVTNVEGILRRIKQQIESIKESEDDKNTQKKAKNMIKKLNKVMMGNDSLKIVIDDPTGNSAIISDKAVSKKK